jgi:hypothetical protein
MNVSVMMKLTLSHNWYILINNLCFYNSQTFKTDICSWCQDYNWSSRSLPLSLLYLPFSSLILKFLLSYYCCTGVYCDICKSSYNISYIVDEMSLFPSERSILLLFTCFFKMEGYTIQKISWLEIWYYFYRRNSKLFLFSHLNSTERMVFIRFHCSCVQLSSFGKMYLKGLHLQGHQLPWSPVYFF